MDNRTTPNFDLDLEMFAEELEDTSAAGLSTAGCFASVGTFTGSCASSASSFSTASS